ncbi:MAG TPA: hypothetical protein VGO11_20805 [Chthoniobacteraceae bacterium]|jgi:hypothetical protein|nr:hypothetical protein [Chthoniobacteraceae bacterium]
MPNIFSIIKNVRNVMRRDRGVSGDAQRLEQLGWMLFLKILDDKDKDQALELIRAGYKSTMPDPGKRGGSGRRRLPRSSLQTILQTISTGSPRAQPTRQPRLRSVRGVGDCLVPMTDAATPSANFREANGVLGVGQIRGGKGSGLS